MESLKHNSISTKSLGTTTPSANLGHTQDPMNPGPNGTKGGENLT